MVQGKLDKEFLCRTDPFFLPTMVSLKNVTSSLGYFNPEVLQSSLLSALFLTLFSIKNIEKRNFVLLATSL